MAMARLDSRVELISADSMQVYRGMDIGTAKPTLAEQKEIRHHVIDVIDPHEDYGVSRFQSDARQAIQDIHNRAKRAVIVGGTGLYVRAVVDDLDIPDQYPDVRKEIDAEPNTAALYARLLDLDPVAAGRMDPENRRRVTRALEVCVGSGRPFSSFGPGMERYPEVPFVQVGVERTRDDIDERIALRYAQQMQDGLLDEVRTLVANPGGMSRTARQALGYKELLLHIEEGLPLFEALDLAGQRTRRFARRQQKWFRRDPRILWLDGTVDPVRLAEQVLSGDVTSLAEHTK